MGNRNRDKGNNYERKIAQELRDLGFNDVVTSRYASKETDDNKIDLVFQNKSCDLNIQLKKTTNVPQYFKIRSESNSEPENFCLIWNKQEKKSKNFCSAGELVMIDKQLFYKLIKNQYIMSKEIKDVEMTNETPVAEKTTVTFAGDKGKIEINFSFVESTGQLDYTVNTDEMNNDDKLAVFLADTFMGMLTRMDSNGEEEESTDAAEPIADSKESVVETKE